MGLLDTLETVASGAKPFAKPAFTIADGLPIVGNVLSAGEFLYHLGSGGYDALTGDRDGAVAHGAQAAVAGLEVIPGIHEAASVLNPVMGIAGGISKLFGQATNDEALSDAPMSIGGAAAQVSVMATNALLGADESKPTGTRRGELGSGIAMLLPGGAAAPLLNAIVGNPVGNAAGSLFGVDEAAPSSGAGKPSPSQRAGRSLHRLFDDLF